MNVKEEEEDGAAERGSGAGANGVGGGPPQRQPGIKTEEGEDASAETTARRDIENPSYWDRVDRAAASASNGGTRSRRRRRIADAAELPDDEDGDDDLDRLDSDGGGGRGDGGGGRREVRTTSKDRMRRRAIASATVTGRSSNLGARRAFSWRRIGSDPSNPDGDERDSMDTAADDRKELSVSAAIFAHVAPSFDSYDGAVSALRLILEAQDGGGGPSPPSPSRGGTRAAGRKRTRTPSKRRRQGNVNPGDSAGSTTFHRTQHPCPHPLAARIRVALDMDLLPEFLGGPVFGSILASASASVCGDNGDDKGGDDDDRSSSPPPSLSKGLVPWLLGVACSSPSRGGRMNDLSEGAHNALRGMLRRETTVEFAAADPAAVDPGAVVGSVLPRAVGDVRCLVPFLMAVFGLRADPGGPLIVLSKEEALRGEEIIPGLRRFLCLWGAGLDGGGGHGGESAVAVANSLAEEEGKERSEGDREILARNLAALSRMGLDPFFHSGRG